MAYLRSLGIGDGYTADDGASFPFRGKGVGSMPEPGDVLAAFPGRQNTVNYKSNEAREADMLAARLAAEPAWRQQLWGVYGGRPPSYRARQRIGPDAADRPLIAFTNRDFTNCLLQYLALGWTGHVPDPCRNTAIMVPINLAWLAWGWPNLFLERLQDVGSQVILLGPYEAGDPGTSGIDTLDHLAAVPAGFICLIERIGPTLNAR